MRFRRNRKTISLRERFAMLRESRNTEKLPVDIEDEEIVDDEDTDEATITLTPSDVAVLRKILGKVDATVTEPEDEDEGEIEDEGDKTCPGCDDPNCPDCNPTDVEEAPADVGEEEAPADVGEEEFEVPDVSDIEDSREEDEVNYFS